MTNHIPAWIRALPALPQCPAMTTSLKAPAGETTAELEIAIGRLLAATLESASAKAPLTITADGAKKRAF